MRMQILGADGGIARHMRTSALLVDDDILIDAGTGVGDLSLAEMSRVDHVFVTHAHMDHLACLPLMLDSVVTRRRTPVTVRARQEAIDAIRTHLFNDVIWPDFTRIPTPESPVLRFEVAEWGRSHAFGDRRITVLPADHPGAACGFALDSGLGTLAFSGDTGPCDAFWEAINAIQNLTHLIIETSFGDSLDWLAHKTGHLTPSMLAGELRKLARPARVFYSHVKPHCKDVIPAEVARLLADWDIQPLARGQIITF
jgi:ribonuclease BN (tRNA processing enzyme)